MPAVADASRLPPAAHLPQMASPLVLVTHPVVFDPGGSCPSSPKTLLSLSDRTSLLDSLSSLQLLSPSCVMDVGHSLDTIIAKATADASSTLGTDIVYDDTLFDSLGLEDFQPEHFTANDASLTHTTLDSILTKHLTRLREKGLKRDEIASLLAGADNVSNVIDLIVHGSRSFMIPSFRPNGGRECSIGGSYSKYRRLCNDALVSLVRDGKAIIFSKDALIAHGVLDQLMLSPFVWAPKANKVKGRTCFNLSKATKSFPSVNESVDIPASTAFYPRNDLPLLPDVAEMICRQRDLHPDEKLSGATVDVRSAYNQFSQSVGSAKYHASLVRVPDPEGVREWKQLVLIYLVGAFGFVTSGDIYCLIGNAITQRHNANEPALRSLSYIDDGILVSPSSKIDASLAEYIRLVVGVFGPDGVNEEKVKLWDHGLEAIGWEFDFEQWRVQPKRRGVLKMIHYLFTVIPLGSRFIHEKDLERLQGIVSWYSSGLPSGRAFTASFFSCARLTDSSRFRLSDLALHDLSWWRALSLVAWSHPQTLGASISAVRRNKIPTRFLQTDASSTVGGGARLSLDAYGADALRCDDAIRWTQEELRVFEILGVSINVLEYYSAIYFILLWADDLKGEIVHLECDNTSAVSWVMKSRATRGGACVDALIKIFTLFILKHDIVVHATHIRGVDNVIADFRSRDLDHLSQGADELLVKELVHGQQWSALPRKVLCRSLLYISITSPEVMQGRTILDVLTSLGGTLGPDIVV